MSSPATNSLLLPSRTSPTSLLPNPRTLVHTHTHNHRRFACPDAHLTLFVDRRRLEITSDPFAVSLSTALQFIPLGEILSASFPYSLFACSDETFLLVSLIFQDHLLHRKRLPPSNLSLLPRAQQLFVPSDTSNERIRRHLCFLHQRSKASRSCTFRLFEDPLASGGNQSLLRWSSLLFRSRRVSASSARSRSLFRGFSNGW